jgi:hypothetical protein
MHRIYRLDSTGHGVLAEWEPQNKVQVKKAEEVFTDLARNHALVDISAPERPKPAMPAFDPTASEILAIPNLVGG